MEAAGSAGAPVLTAVLAGARWSSCQQGGEHGGSEACPTWSVWFPRAARLRMTFWDEFSPPQGTLVEEALEKAAQSWASVLAGEAIHWLLERNVYFVSKILDVFALYANLWPLSRHTLHYRDKDRNCESRRTLLPAPSSPPRRQDIVEACTDLSSTSSYGDYTQLGAVPDHKVELPWENTCLQHDAPQSRAGKLSLCKGRFLSLTFQLFTWKWHFKN